MPLARRQSVGARVEACREDDGLSDARCGRIGEEVVEVLGADRHSFGETVRVEQIPFGTGFDVSLRHLGEVVDADRTHQRLGEYVDDQGCCAKRGEGA